MVLYINILVLSELIFTTTQMEKSQVIRLFSSGTFWQTGSLFIKQHIYLFPPIYSIFHISRGCGTEGQMPPTKFQILLFNRFLPKKIQTSCIMCAPLTLHSPTPPIQNCFRGPCIYLWSLCLSQRLHLIILMYVFVQGRRNDFFGGPRIIRKIKFCEFFTI